MKYKVIWPLILLFISLNLHASAKDQTRQTRISTNGDYTVTVESWLQPLRIGRMHAWTAEIKDAEGKPVKNAKIKIGGGMPIHNHGFPTEPIMTRQIEPGTYLLEGFKFSMAGPWVIFLDISADKITDSVAFDIDM